MTKTDIQNAIEDIYSIIIEYRRTKHKKLELGEAIQIYKTITQNQQLEQIKDRLHKIFVEMPSEHYYKELSKDIREGLNEIANAK